MKIDSAQLLEIVDRLKQKITETFPDGIELDVDFYWALDEDEIFAIDDSPQNTLMSQLFEDWSELSRLMDDDEEPLSYDLKRLAAIFQFIRIKSIGKW